MTSPVMSGAAIPAPVLQLEGIRAGYGRIEVLHDLSITVQPSTVFALLGPNGAGKSTALKVASGRLVPTGGRVLVNGVDVKRRPTESLSRDGICVIPEGRGIFPNLTVTENLRMWTYTAGLRSSEVEEVCFRRFPLLAARRKQLAGTLSGGEQQMLAMSRALSSNATLLLLDEISMGLAPIIVSELFELVHQLAEDGISILLVEQFAKAALAIASHAAIMSQGRIEKAGQPFEVATALVDVYLRGAR